MTITSPSTEARQALRTILQTTFAPEGFQVLNDRLHESIGRDGTRIGTSPNRERLLAGNDLVLTCELFVQFYGKWKGEIDPNTRVDPAVIENYAERFRRAVQAAPKIGDERVWYFKITEIVYPQDPTGNKTRFEATVIAYGNNSGLMETTG